MRIAFDLDDTLIPTAGRFATEAPRGAWPLRVFAVEPLRAGASELLRGLRREGHALWVYTSSARGPVGVHLLFLAYGVRLDGVVNLDRHETAQRRAGSRRIKDLAAFGIDLLVDDSVAAVDEALRHGERAVRVAPDDDRWVERVLAAVQGR